jgi:hypothetical protein
VANRLDGNVHVAGNLTANSLSLPANAVTDVSVLGPIGADKLEHQHQITAVLSNHGVDAATTRRALHKLFGATGEMVAFRAWASTPAGATTTLSIHLKRNGSNITSAPIVLDNGQAAFAAVDAPGFTSTALVAGDVLEVDATLTGTNEPQGVSVQLIVREDAD